MILRLPLPPSVNAMWRSIARLNKAKKPYSTVLLSKEGRQFKKDAAGWLAVQQTEVLEGPVEVVATVYFPNRRGDLDNRLKPLLDVLQGVCYRNDAQVHAVSLRRGLDKECPRVTVTVTRYHAPDEPEFDPRWAGA